MRQRRIHEKRFNYAEVGITGGRDTTADRSRRGRVTDEVVQIGRGEARWKHAWTQTLSWGIQRHAGYAILPVPDTSEGGDVSLGDAEEPYAQMQQGMTVRLRRRFGPLIMTMPVRVVYVVDEPHRKGFAFGTLSGHPVSGEVAFIVEHRADDSVHFLLRTYSGPGKGIWALAYPIVLLFRGGLKNTYLESLAGPLC
ncbi:DUF1990 family protein [Gulosibacter molinativorax]|uniref:DUF1990 domain-containing protein n=1 Tax=Gulosibacter molinativorax TaxID=256821 RepID=A0ABT7CBT8_9MICO|nr:DUF1990 domain-containing protein [Gulosibacter molinativorax]MDJ1372667.1 DUF1990 domain-containing protein [Gulosibacter molinativorax]QUY60980.1 Hypotetical protein [Gulosibacter molinativorax]